MLEKNINAFSDLLRELNFPETAEIFKHEFLAKPNDEYQLGKYNILKHLQTQLNKCTGNSYAHSFNPSSKKNTRSKNEKFDNFINKIVSQKKITPHQQDSSTSTALSQSNLYLKLGDKIEKNFKRSLQDNKLCFSISPQINKYDPDEPFNVDNKEDLPIFGSNMKRENSFTQFMNKEEDKNETNDAFNASFGYDNNPNINKNENNKVDDMDDDMNNNNNNNNVDNNCNTSFGRGSGFSNNSDMNNNNNEDDIDNRMNQIYDDPYQDEDDSIDEYQDDDDVGFDLYECDRIYFEDTCQKLSEQAGFPKKGVYKSKYKNYIPGTSSSPYPTLPTPPMNAPIKLIQQDPNDKKNLQFKANPNQDSVWAKSKLDKHLSFPFCKDDPVYPVFYKNEFIDAYNLKFIVDRERTGFEESKDFKIVINNLIAGRYQILAYLGNAAFSKAVKCLDIKENKLVCLKIIENHKDYFDQSLGEIKVLKYINANGDSEDKHFLKLYDYFYHKEHLFIITELLKDNLYDFQEYTNKNKMEKYFTLPRLQKIATQVLICLDYIHSLRLIHCDLKPENILIKSITETKVKVIDFGSSSFIHDMLSSYIVSRSYRAPEIVMGCKYDYKIDLWSLGCIMAELYTGNVLFQSDSVHSLMARIVGIAGPIPDWMYEKGETVKDIFTKEKLIYMEAPVDNMHGSSRHGSSGSKRGKKMHVIVPKKTSLKKRIRCDDENFLDFLKKLLTVDPNLRLSAKEALKHKWLTQVKY